MMEQLFEFVSLFSVCVATLGAFALWWLGRRSRARAAEGAALLASLPGSVADRGGFWAHREASFVPLVQRHGRTFAYYVDEVGNFGTMRGKTMVATCEPALVREILVKKAHTQRRPEQYRLARFLPGLDGVLFQDGAVWEKHTKALFPNFQGKHFRALGSAVQRIAARSVRAWGGSGSGSVDVLPLLHRIVTQCVVRVGFGLLPESAEGVALAASLRTFMETEHALRESGFEALSVWGHLRAFFRAYSWFQRDFSNVRAKVRPVLARTAAERGGSGGRSGGDSKGWIELMRDAGIEEKAISSEVNHLHDAHKALAVVLTFALYRLAQPRAAVWVALMRRERAAAAAADTADTAADGGNATGGLDALKLLPVTRAVFREVLRMHTISMGVVRTTGAPVQATVGAPSEAPREVTIPAGTDVLLLLHALHHLPELWERPTEFEPQRWLRLDRAACTAADLSSALAESDAAPSAGDTLSSRIDVIGPHQKWTWFPFLDGRRQCAGRQLAEFEFTIILHEVLDAFDIDDDASDTELRLAPDFYPVPEQPVRLKLTRRAAVE